MQKQKKNLYSKKFNLRKFKGPGLEKYSNPFFRAFKKLKNINRARRILKYSSVFPRSLRLNNLNFTTRIHIRITSNNVFCSLIKANKINKVGSAGIFKIKTSVKKLRFSSKIILEMFFRRIKKYINTNKILINIIGPIKLKKKIVKQLISLKNTYLKKSFGSVVINTQAKKCFNGCRPPKKIRKKRRYIRLTK